MIVPLNSWYHRGSVPNKLIAYTEMVLWTGVSTHNMTVFARSIELTALFTFLYYKFEILSLVKINVTETVLHVHPSTMTRWSMSMMPRFSEKRGSARLSMG